MYYCTCARPTHTDGKCLRKTVDVMLVAKLTCTVNEKRERRKRKKKLEKTRVLAETESYTNGDSVGRIKGA